MKTAITLRDATVADLAFLTDSNMAMALETEHKTLDRGVLRRGIAGVFDKPERGFYLVAEQAGKAVGCLMVTYEWSDWRDGNWWWLQSVYVVSCARGLGVFRALHVEVERRARAEPGVLGCRLYVERDNRRAREVYASCGMQESSYRIYEQLFA